MFEIYWQPEIRKYKASFFSRAFIFQFLCLLAVFVSPLIIVFRSYGFWIKEDTYREQPGVSFKYQAILVLQTGSQQYTWSTYANLNALQQGSLLSPVMRVRQVDNNLDGLFDYMQMRVEVPLADTEVVYSVKLMLLFDYTLSKMSSFKMECMALIDYGSSLPGSTLTVSGDLVLKQKNLLGYKDTDTRFAVPIVDGTSVRASDYRLSTIFSTYQQRNVTTNYENTLYLWETGRPAGDPFKINATVFFTTPVIGYKPGFWFALKWAWVQYVPVMLLFLFIVDRIKVFAFENQIVPTVVQRPHFDCRKGA